MISPKRYSWSFDGEMKESLDGDFIDASDYYNMTEKLKGDIAKAGVKAVKRFNPEINDLKSRITELQSQLEIQSDIIKALDNKNRVYDTFIKASLRDGVNSYDALAHIAENDPADYMRHVTKTMMIEYT